MDKENDERLSDVDKIIDGIKSDINEIEEPIKKEVVEILDKTLRKKMNDLEMYVKEYNTIELQGYLFAILLFNTLHTLLKFYKIEAEHFFKRDTIEFKQKLAEILKENFEDDLDEIFMEPVRRFKEMKRKAK